MLRLSSCFFSALVVFGLAQQACQPKAKSTSSPKGLVTSYNIPWPGGVVDVCWAPQEYGELSDLKSYLEAHIVPEYARAGITIQGWKECPVPLGTEGPYPIFFGSDGNYTNGTGYTARHDGVNLDVVTDLFANPSVSSKGPCTVEGSPIIDKECILATAIHEFGHFVGLMHEHERTDVWERCRVEALAARPYYTHFGDYDAQSIMNYCVNDDFAFGKGPQPLSLSNGDIATIRAIYSQTSTILATNAEHPGSFIDQNELRVNVVSDFTTSYRYQVLHVDGVKEQTCEANGYSQEIFPKSQPIQADLQAYQDGVIKVCVLGTNAQGIEQAPVVYSSVSFIIDRTPWALVTGNDWITDPSQTIKVSGKNIRSYQYKLVSTDLEGKDISTAESLSKAQNPCLEDEGYGEPVPVNQAITVGNLKRGSQYATCVRGIGEDGQVQSRLKTTQFYFNYAGPDGVSSN